MQEWEASGDLKTHQHSIRHRRQLLLLLRQN